MILCLPSCLLPLHLRATAFGLLNALCKLAAVLGSSIFASFVGITKAIPILLSFSALVCGGLVALKLPDTRQKILHWGPEMEAGRSEHFSFLLEAVWLPPGNTSAVHAKRQALVSSFVKIYRGGGAYFSSTVILQHFQKAIETHPMGTMIDWWFSEVCNNTIHRALSAAAAPCMMKNHHLPAHQTTAFVEAVKHTSSPQC